VSGLETEISPTGGAFAAELMYSKAAMLADEAMRHGYRDLARSLEASNSDFLRSMPREQQKRALAISYEMTLAQASAEPAPPRIRLAYSRD
jgi:hypothetical protein